MPCAPEPSDRVLAGGEVDQLVLSLVAGVFQTEPGEPSVMAGLRQHPNAARLVLGWVVRGVSTGLLPDFLTEGSGGTREQARVQYWLRVLAGIAAKQGGATPAVRAAVAALAAELAAEAH